MSMSTSAPVLFRIVVGSYEHNLLCLSLILKENSEPIFTPIFHFQAHTLSIKSIDIAKRYLVTGSNDEHIRIYDLKKRKELGTLLSHQGTVTTLKFSKEIADKDDPTKTGKWLLLGSDDGKIIIWRTKDWEMFGTLKGHQGRVNDLDIHPSGRVAISVSTDKTIRLWNLMTAKKAAVLKIKGRDHLGQSGEMVRWCSDGSHFLVGLLNQIFVYSLGAEAELAHKILIDSTLMCMEVLNIDGTEYLTTGHSNGTLRFYQVGDIIEKKEDKPEPAFTLRGHSNRIKGISFYQSDADTNGVPYLVSVSSDGRIVVWNVREDVRDQVAVYDSGERLNCVAACGESIENTEAIKRRHEDDIETKTAIESEYESDGEELKNDNLGKNRKKGKKNKKPKVSVTLE